MVGLPYHMRPWDEIIGIVHKVEERDDHCLAQIGEFVVSLPNELAPRLKELRNQRVGILRSDKDFLLRVLNHRREAKTSTRCDLLMSRVRER